MGIGGILFPFKRNLDEWISFRGLIIKLQNIDHLDGDEVRDQGRIATDQRGLVNVEEFTTDP